MAPIMAGWSSESTGGRSFNGSRVNGSRVKDQIDELCELSSDESQMTDWEVEFVDSVDKQFRQRGFLSPKQLATLRQIHDKHCRGG